MSLDSFRIVFELESPITCPERMEKAVTALVSLYGADKKCKDPSHFFYGNTNAKMWLLGKVMPDDAVEALVQRGIELATPKHSLSAGGDTVTKRSSTRIGKTQLIHLREGGWDHLNNIPPRTSVHCPFHEDERASAVVLPTHTGDNCIYCFGENCESVFFQEGAHLQPYRFDYGWESAIRVEASAQKAHAQRMGTPLMPKLEASGAGRPLSTMLNQQPFDPSRDYSPYLITLDQPFLSLAEIAIRHPRFADDLMIDVDNNVYLSDLGRPQEQGLGELDSSVEEEVEALVKHRWLSGSGITFIKSPKGTGKTTLLKGIVDYCQVGPANSRVLLIGHRRALIGATAHAIGLTSYLKSVEGKVEEYNEPAPCYAICLDSLLRLDPAKHRYDVIIIDEVEQVFSHLLSSTLKGKRSNIMALLQEYLKQARQVLVMDADLSQLTLGVMNALDTDWPERHEFVVLNQFKPEGRRIHLYHHPRPNHLLGVLVDYLKQGKRCYVCTNSRKLANNIFHQAQRELPEIKAMVVTSENSNTSEGQYFIQNIVTEALKYDLMVSSPSLGTGIDITFPDGESRIDAVFGIFSTRHTTHFDMDQQICRVRHPQEVHVWISGATYISETDPAVLEMDVESMQGQFVHYQGFDQEGKPIIGPVDVMHRRIYAAVAQTRRASMNRLRENFEGLKAYQGWEVIAVPYDKPVGKVGSQFMKAADDLCRQQEADRLLSARAINYAEADRLAGMAALSPEDKATLERFRLEQFYRQDIDADLLALDAEGAHRAAVRHYLLLVSPDDHAFWGATEEEAALLDRGKRFKMKRAMTDILAAAGLWTSSGFDTSAVVEKKSLVDFVAACRRNEQALLDHYGVKIRSRLEEKPTQQLGDILKMFGLTWEGGKGKRDQSGGESRMLYRIDREAHARLIQGYQMNTDEDRLLVWKRKKGL